MAAVTRKTYSTGLGPKVSDGVNYRGLGGPFYASSNLDGMEAMTPVYIKWNSTNERYELEPSGGTGVALGDVKETVDGWTRDKAIYSTGPNAIPMAIVEDGEFSNYSNKTTNAAEWWYLSGATAGALVDAGAYEGARPVARRFFYNEAGERIRVWGTPPVTPAP